MERITLAGTVIVPLLFAGCVTEYIETDTTRGTRVLRVTLDNDPATGDLRLAVDGKVIETKADVWPPAVSMPDAPSGLTVAFHASGDIAFEKVQPVLRQLAIAKLTMRVIILEKPETPVPEWHWSKDIDLLPPELNAAARSETVLPDIKIRLRASQDSKIHVNFGSRNLGTSPEVYKRLNLEMLKLIGRPGDPLTKELTVELDPGDVVGEADDDIQWSEVRKAILACSGRRDDNIPVRYIERFRIVGVTSEPQIVEEELELLPVDSQLLFENNIDAPAIDTPTESVDRR